MKGAVLLGEARHWKATAHDAYAYPIEEFYFRMPKPETRILNLLELRRLRLCGSHPPLYAIRC